MTLSTIVHGSKPFFLCPVYRRARYVDVPLALPRETEQFTGVARYNVPTRAVTGFYLFFLGSESFFAFLFLPHTFLVYLFIVSVKHLGRAGHSTQRRQLIKR